MCLSGVLISVLNLAFLLQALGVLPAAVKLCESIFI